MRSVSLKSESKSSVIYAPTNDDELRLFLLAEFNLQLLFLWPSNVSKRQIRIMIICTALPQNESRKLKLCLVNKTLLICSSSNGLLVMQSNEGLFSIPSY